MKPILTAKEATELRDRAIEKCAREVDVHASISSRSDYQELLHRVSAAIRALKDKP